MIRHALALLLCFTCVTPALAQLRSPADAARLAAEDLTRAADRLDAAAGAEARLLALTQVVQAYEAGLSSLRAGIRQIRARSDVLGADLARREAEIGRLLAALDAMNRTPAPVLLIHPSGPRGTAQAAMLLAEIAPELDRRAEALRRDLADLSSLLAIEADAGRTLEADLDEIQSARVVLSEAMAERGDLPVPVARDRDRIAALRSRGETLTAFADALDALPLPGVALVPEKSLPLPAPGRPLRRFMEADAAGIERPGLIIATAPGAQVTAPVGGTIRYAGPLLDYDNVIVLEPRPDLLMVFAGLRSLYVEGRDVVDRAAPLGQMGGSEPNSADLTQDNITDGGAPRAETLYIEVRQGGVPTDPATWFAAE